MSNFRKNNISKMLTFKVVENVQLLPFIMERMYGISRNKAKALIVNRVVLVDNTITTFPLTELRPGQVVQIDRSKHKMSFHSNDIDIVYEDPYLLVVDKRAGLLSMSNNTRQETVQTVLNRYLEKGGGRNTSHLVHRLDRDTSGLMLYAKDVQTQQSFVQGWQELVTDRRYVALVSGEMENERGTIRSWLTEDKHFVTHSSPVDNGGKYAVTHYNVLAKSNGYSLVELELETGRKNQIRVHLAQLGYPIVGDRKYGSEDDSIKRLALHAYILCFQHPVTGKYLRFQTPVPLSFEKCLNGK
ncbi:MAG: RluA family pseudouridine synthase [Bacteroidaceae bacterium]|nr:RluA family pseudouridine synthase [Bacteroidales bacterium]MBQ2877336.1 RluA family pseudouridine synthase [Bacteroidaceae bacterium]MBQ3623062.1 RluA family pseudouridine synthase [Bacteroidaceae bacterium]MBR7135349.1 RluA family pseudouridine synthase [Bacteroidaceae bacterium]